MSADNYYLIKKHPHGGYTAVMGFASDDHTPQARETDPTFDTVDQALTWALDQYSEYGVAIDDECNTPTLTITTSHGSSYEIDQENKNARRIPGPDRHAMHADGQWFAYWSVHALGADGQPDGDIEIGRSAIFLLPGFAWRTTTPITNIQHHTTHTPSEPH